MSRSYAKWPAVEQEAIIASYQAGVCIRDLERSTGRNHRQIQDLLYDRGLLRRPCVRIGKPKPAGPGLSVLAGSLVMRRRVGILSETPEEMERLIEAVRYYMGGQTSGGTGEYERPEKGGIERVIELRSAGAQVASG